MGKQLNETITPSSTILQFHAYTESVNATINREINKILAKYGREEQSDLIISAVKELIYNATKANLKRAFFHEEGLRLDEMGDYAKGLVKFKALLGSSEIHRYFDLFRKLDLWSRLSIEHSRLGMRIEVSNHSAIAPIEEKRVRMKLAIAMSRSDIMEFYRQASDQSEGAGLGIALVVNLMRSIDVNPALFRVWSAGNVTTARIEIPFSDEYTLLRSI